MYMAAANSCNLGWTTWCTSRAAISPQRLYEQIQC